MRQRLGRLNHVSTSVCDKHIRNDKLQGAIKCWSQCHFDFGAGRSASDDGRAALAAWSEVRARGATSAAGFAAAAAAAALPPPPNAIFTAIAEWLLSRTYSSTASDFQRPNFLMLRSSVNGAAAVAPPDRAEWPEIARLNVLVWLLIAKLLR